MCIPVNEVKKLLGIEPEDVNSGFFINAIHPDDFDRLGIGKVSYDESD